MKMFDIQEFLSDLKTMCGIASGLHNAAGTTAMAEFLEEKFRSLGLHTEIRWYEGNDFAPFLCANQYVNFDAAPNTVAMAAALCGGMTDPLKKVESIYYFVVNNMTYDKELASTVKSGYLPELDKVLEKKKGICCGGFAIS